LGFVNISKYIISGGFFHKKHYIYELKYDLDYVENEIKEEIEQGNKQIYCMKKII
jgi:hypothetical protein